MGVSVGVRVNVGVIVGVSLGMGVGVRVNVGVMVGVLLGVGVGVKVTARSLLGSAAASKSTEIHPPAYCANSAFWSGANWNQVPSSLRALK